MFLYSAAADPPKEYSRGLNDSSALGSVNKNNVGKVLADRSSETVTHQPVHSEPEQTKPLPNSQQSYPSHPQNFPYQPTTTITDRLRELSLKYEIEATLAKRLRQLQDYEIIIVCDDSGSMKTTVNGTDRTRWDELRSIVKIVLEIGTIFDSSGVDIYFLNRPAMFNVTDPTVIDKAFFMEPRGYTPLVRALSHIFQLPATQRGNDKKALVFVATDGAPTDDKGNINVMELEHLMVDIRHSETTHVMFLVCTDDPACVDYLTEWDRTMVNVDVTDDYKTERAKIRSFQGANYPFSLGDYIAKALLGAIDREIDHLNQPGLTDNVNAK